MPNCLLGLGSNAGDSPAILRAAVAEIGALPNVQLVRQSAWHRARAVGGPRGQADFVNGAIVVETSIPPLQLLAELQQIEDRHGRSRAIRWGPRSLDIDVLLYGNEVCETEMLTLPHPRMSFRRFVLEPAAEIAAKTRHPVIGWPIERLLLHLQCASDSLAIVSPDDGLRSGLSGLLVRQRSGEAATPPTFDTADRYWPPQWTEWLRLPPAASSCASEPPAADLPYVAAAFPKLSVLLDASGALHGAARLKWSTLVRQPGRGPMLRLQTSNRPEIEAELLAAVEAVWA